MSKSFVLNRSGSTPTLDNYPVSKVPVYATQADAEADISNIEDGTIIATRDGAINSSIIAQQVIDEVTPEVDNLVQGSGVPAGTIVYMDTQATVNGWLKCNGGTFDKDQYPFLYAALQSETLPLAIEPDEDELNKELFTGELYLGKPVYKFKWQETASRSSDTWGVASPNGELYFPYAHDIKNIVKAEIRTAHNTTYRLGSIDSNIFQITNAALVDGAYKVQSNSQLYYYTPWNLLASAEDPRTLTIYYIKNTDDLTNAKFKYIRALSGTEATAEAAQVTNAINQYRQTLVDTSGIPCGSIVNGLYIGTPDGFLPCDGSTFDQNDYPLLYAKLGNSNVLPVIYDPTSLPEQPDFRGSNRTNGYTGDFPIYSNVASVFAAAGVDLNGNGFEHDGIIILTSAAWEMLWIQNPDGTKFCAGQFPFTDSEGDHITMPVKKGQKIYAYSRTSTATVPTAGDYQNAGYFYFSIYYYQRLAYIKAFSGINDGTEANAVVTAINDLKSRVAYSSMPLGNVIQMKDNSYVPTGYLLADGRDTTGTTDELETVYPLLYAYNGNSNVLPEIGDELDYDHPDYLGTWDGSQVSAWSWNNNYNNTFTMTRAGYLTVPISAVAAECGWVTINGVTVTKFNAPDNYADFGQRGFFVKKGDVVSVHLGWASGYGGYYANYFTLIPYKTFKYIKAVTGVETASTEATEVANGISVAEAAMQTQYDTFVQEVEDAEWRKEYDLYDGWPEGASTYTPIASGAVLTDSIYNYDKIQIYMVRSQYPTDMVAISEFTHRQIMEWPAKRFLIAHYGSEYVILEFDSGTGLTATTITNSSAYVYRIVGVGKRS